ncbi:MAG: hypothetical protein HZC10_10775 [Nitrospirae bacterium]|nr:hypothetical protein [Nitrospirota bacterium]
MKRSGSLSVFLMVMLFIASCATVYQPKRFTGGYSDVQLDKNTVQVTFQGNAYTSKETVNTYLLYRCAETTIKHGFDYFVIIDRGVDVKHGVITTPGSYGYGIYTPGQAIPYQKYSDTAIIKMFKGEKSDDIPNAYNAKELMNYLEPHIKR